MRLAFALLIFLAAVPASAQDAQPKPGQTPSAADVSFQGYGDRDKTCAIWEDGCRTCRRDGTNISCSNIGIACQPAAITCKVSDADLKKLLNPPKQ